MSYWEIRDALHQLMTRAAAFHDQLMAEDPDWEDLWQCHLELCRIEEYFRWRQDQ